MHKQALPLCCRAVGSPAICAYSCRSPYAVDLFCTWLRSIHAPRLGTPPITAPLPVLQIPEASASPDASVCSRLFVKLLSDYLNEMAYPAELAGLHYGISVSLTGFEVTLGGYNHKLPQLLSAVMDKITHFEVSKGHWDCVGCELRIKLYKFCLIAEKSDWVIKSCPFPVSFC